MGDVSAEIAAYLQDDLEYCRKKLKQATIINSQSKIETYSKKVNNLSDWISHLKQYSGDNK